MLDSEQMQNRSVNVMNVDGAVHGKIPIVIEAAVAVSSL
jgi:hypothetical protein